MARKTSIILIAAILAGQMALSKARAQSASDLNPKTQSADALNNVDCGPIMNELRRKTPHDVATDLKVPVPTVYICMRAAKAARAKRIGEPSARATGAGAVAGAGIAATATPAPTPAM